MSFELCLMLSHLVLPRPQEPCILLEATEPPATKSCPAPSLATLPYELKQEIVDHLAASVKPANRTRLAPLMGFFEERAAEQRRRRWVAEMLRPLSLIDRACRSACEPYLWQALALRNSRSSSLVPFLREVLPEHAGTVKAFHQGGSFAFYRRNNCTADTTEGEKASLITTAEEATGVTDLQVRYSRAHVLLETAIFKACSHVQEVVLRSEILAPPTTEQQDDLVQAVLSRGDQITALTLEFASGDAGPVIQACPNLASLDLYQAPYSEDAPRETRTLGRFDYSSVRDALLSLQHLRHLKLDASQLLTLDFLRSPFPFHLETLDVQDRSCRAALSSFQLFFSRFADTLTSLSFYTKKATKIGRLKKAFLLPRLRHLALGSSFSREVLTLFAPSPLATLRLGLCAMLEPDDVIDELVGPCSDTLLRVHAEEDFYREADPFVRFGAYATEHDRVEDVAEACAEIGVRFTCDDPHRHEGCEKCGWKQW
ncbi:hypothetical protein JCM3770_003572 [Rhodotorula araucariae]